MIRSRAFLAAFLTTLLVASVFAMLIPVVPTVAGAQSAPTATANNSTATATPNGTPTALTLTPTPTPAPPVPVDEQLDAARGGTYNITELQQSGREDVRDIDGVRGLGDPPMGFAAARYRNPSLLNVVFGSEPPWLELNSTSTVQQNELQIYGSAFGEVAGEYDVVVVYWQPKETKIQTGATNRTVTVAGNQTVDRQTIEFGGHDIYTYNTVELRPHFDQTYRVTMWLERDGEPVDARWTFRHRSNPESAAVNINSAAGAWAYALKYAVFPGIGSLIVGLILSRLTLRRTGRGPGYGIGAWVLLVAFVGLAVASVAYYQIAVILQNLPYVMGLSFGLVAFGAGLTFHEPVRRIGFWQRELFEAITIDRESDGGAAADGGVAAHWDDIADPGEVFDELTESVLADLPEVPVVRTEDGYRVPVPGVRPFFARLFAQAAEFDPTAIATRMKIGIGRLDDIIFVDPTASEAVTHDPARLKRVLPWDTLEEDPTGTQELIAAAFTVLILAGPALAGWRVFDHLWNIPGVGLLMGIMVTLVIAYSAEDGRIEFEPAPPHFKKAEDQLTVLQRAYKEAADKQDAREDARRERARTVREAREDQQAEQKTFMGELLGSESPAEEANDGDG